MASSVGPAPWTQGFKRVTKKTARDKGGLDFTWRQYRDSTWQRPPLKANHKTVRLASGQTVYVPDADYEDFIGFRSSGEPLADPYGEVSQYIDKAFANLDKVQDVDGVGHIAYIEYSPTYQVLRVEFANDGAVVVYFRVPKEVYAELAYLAKSGSKQLGTDGSERYTLGIRFWDIIRIRGQREGGRYRYEYVQEGDSHARQSHNEVQRASRAGLDVVDYRVASDEQIKDLRLHNRRLDDFARKRLTGAQLTTYNKLTDFVDKEDFLAKLGLDTTEIESTRPSKLNKGIDESLKKAQQLRKAQERAFEKEERSQQLTDIRKAKREKEYNRLGQEASKYTQMTQDMLGSYAKAYYMKKNHPNMSDEEILALLETWRL